MKTFQYLYMNILRFILYCTILSPSFIFVLILVDIGKIPLDFRGTDDGSQFIVRNLALSEFLNSHIMYPRWLSDLYYGYGYPVLQFYSPLIYVLVNTIRSVGIKSIDDAFVMLGLIITCCAFIVAMRFSSRL